MPHAVLGVALTLYPVLICEKPFHRKCFPYLYLLPLPYWMNKNLYSESSRQIGTKDAGIAQYIWLK